MYHPRATRKSQRTSISHASRETRFAAVKAALRKQSLTFEPYSNEVIRALWDELQDRHSRGIHCMLRKGLQNALLERLAGPLDDGRMSKNKVNKIFQVLIRSCFVLHSRGGQMEEDNRSLGQTPSSSGPDYGRSQREGEDPPYLDTEWVPGISHNFEVITGSHSPLPDEEGSKVLKVPQDVLGVPPPQFTPSPKSLRRNLEIDGDTTELVNCELSLTPEEAGFFSRTGIMQRMLDSSIVVEDGGRGRFVEDEGGTGVTMECSAELRGCRQGSCCFSSGMGDENRRVSYASRESRDLRASVSSEDLLQGLIIQNQREGKAGTCKGCGAEGIEEVRLEEILNEEDNGQDDDDSCEPPFLERLNSSEDPSVPVHRLTIDAGGGEGGGEEELDDEPAGAVCELRDDVSSLEEVVLTHNAFIRKVALEAGIRLPASEWIIFLEGDSPGAVEESEDLRSRPVIVLPPPEADPLGHMNKEQLYQFRTQWCTRSHPHVGEFCEHGHKEVNHGWLRRDPTKHPYLPCRCRQVTFPAPGVEFLDECPRGRQCPSAHTLEEILFHPQAYKTQICPHGAKCRLRAFCPHGHIILNTLSLDGRPAIATAAVTGSSGSRYPVPPSPDAGRTWERVGGGSGAPEGWMTVGKRGRRAITPSAGVVGRGWVPPPKVRSRSWSGAEPWSPDEPGGGFAREYTSYRAGSRRASGVTGLLAALRKRSADVMQPPAKHEELLKAIYSTLRRREPDGCDEKELVGRVFHASVSTSPTSSATATPGVVISTGVGVSTGLGLGFTSGGGPDSLKVSGDMPFSKTKVRGAVTLLKFAQAVRVGRGEAAGQHVLYVAHELPTFRDFMERHNRHLMEMARELGVDMSLQDWKDLLESESSSTGTTVGPSPTNAESLTCSPAGEGQGSTPSGSPTMQRRPCLCPKPPQQQQGARVSRFPFRLPSPSSRSVTSRSPSPVQCSPLNSPIPNPGQQQLPQQHHTTPPSPSPHPHLDAGAERALWYSQAAANVPVAVPWNCPQAQGPLGTAVGSSPVMGQLPTGQSQGVVGQGHGLGVGQHSAAISMSPGYKLGAGQRFVQVSSALPSQGSESSGYQVTSGGIGGGGGGFGSTNSAGRPFLGQGYNSAANQGQAGAISLSGQGQSAQGQRLGILSGLGGGQSIAQGQVHAQPQSSSQVALPMGHGSTLGAPHLVLPHSETHPFSTSGRAGGVKGGVGQQHQQQAQPASPVPLFQQGLPPVARAPSKSRLSRHFSTSNIPGFFDATDGDGGRSISTSPVPEGLNGKGGQTGHIEVSEQVELRQDESRLLSVLPANTGSGVRSSSMLSLSSGISPGPSSCMQPSQGTTNLGSQLLHPSGLGVGDWPGGSSSNGCGGLGAQQPLHMGVGVLKPPPSRSIPSGQEEPLGQEGEKSDMLPGLNDFASGSNRYNLF